MSYIEIVFFNKKGFANKVREINHSWYGAPSIQETLIKKYLNRKLKIGDDFKDLLNLLRYNEEIFSEDEKICLLSTYKKVLVKKENFEKLIKAFRNFEGRTNLKEQADVIDSLKDNVVAIGWNQISMENNFWMDRTPTYNCFIGNEHWWLSNYKEEIKKGDD